MLIGRTKHMANKAMIETISVVKVAGTGFLFRMKDSPNIKISKAAAKRIVILTYSPKAVFVEKEMTISRMLLANKAM
ncbi:MAG: hypothetical protein ACD_35C00177G0002 [uncultured bacterium]|nr:MAG: hypothetical protein ACD_35C00177G0002 [uncultured bacterium]